MLPLPVQLTPPNLPHQEPVAASLLRHCFSQTRDRQTPWTNHRTKEGGWLWLNHHPWFFNVQHVQKLKGIIYFCFAQNSRRDILPKYLTIYFAKISGTILCQNIPKGFLPKYSERYFARISHQIFCQNIPPNILPEYPARYFGKKLPTYPTRYLAKIATRILWRQSASPFSGPNQKVFQGWWSGWNHRPLTDGQADRVRYVVIISSSKMCFNRFSKCQTANCNCALLWSLFFHG